MLHINESVNVWVLFKGSTIKPFLFFWKTRQIKIEKINLVHTAKEEGSTIYYFSVSSGDSFYRLKFNLNKLKWFLEAVEESD